MSEKTNYSRRRFSENNQPQLAEAFSVDMPLSPNNSIITGLTNIGVSEPLGSSSA